MFEKSSIFKVTNLSVVPIAIFSLIATSFTFTLESNE